MRSGRAGSAAWQWQWHRLFRGGTIAGLSERQLLERFLAQRDEIAFEALVSRHGPMVLAVCRRLLNDPSDVDDAFQATFLVFVRRAATIRDRQRLGSWLYGVAHRVAGRARQDATRRRARETGDVEFLPDRRSAPPPNEDLILLHEEVRRLPEKYRAVIVLCDLESQSHEDAARQLNWPVGSVKGRLFRARNLLRDRLSRRGVSLSVGAIGAALGNEVRGAIVAPSLLDTTVQSGVSFAAGQTVAAGLVSATSVALFQGVHHAMFISKLKLAGALLAAGVVGAGAIAQQGNGDVPATNDGVPGSVVDDPKSKDAPPRVVKEDAPGARQNTGREQALADQLQDARRVRSTAARSMVETLLREYREGRITIDRVIDASRNWSEAEQDTEASIAKKLVGAEGHLGQMSRLLELEQAKMEVGKGNPSNLSEATYAVADAKFRMIQLAKSMYSEDGEHEDTERKTHAAIEGRLKSTIPMPFGQPTPLTLVIKYISSSTITPDLPNGIPIYVDWQVLEQVQQARITIDVDGVPLKKSLENVLHQVGLGYFIRDGLLLISSFNSQENLDRRLQEDEAKRKVPFPDTITVPKDAKKALRN